MAPLDFFPPIFYGTALYRWGSLPTCEVMEHCPLNAFARILWLTATITGYKHLKCLLTLGKSAKRRWTPEYGDLAEVF